MLKKCSYEVTTCCLARHALNLLRERKDGYDIVISDVNMPDMDGFKLLEHVGLEMDLPVIMMSVDGETSRVMKGVQHGACDYLLKPIRMKELRNIWQHVFRKRINEAREFESFEGFESIHLMRNGSEQCDDGNLFALEDMTSTKKRKDADNKHDDRELMDPSSTKKARVVWSVDLHQKFVKAVNQIGFDKVGPKKILDLMNVPWLTRENVASHLQKYRLYLSRLQKENDLKSSSIGIKPELASPDLGSFLGVQSSVNKKQNDVSIDSCSYSDGMLQLQNLETKAHEGSSDPNGTATTEKGRTMTGNIVSDKKMRKSLQMGFNQPFDSLEKEGNHTAVIDCSISAQPSWNKVPEIQLKDQKPLVQLEGNLSQKFPITGKKHQIQVDHQSQSIASISSAPSLTEEEVSACFETKPLCADYKREYKSSVCSIGPAVDNNTFPIEPGSLMMNDPSTQPISTTNLRLKTQASNLNCISDMEFYQRNLLLDAVSVPLDDDLHFSWLHGECSNINFSLQNVGYYDPGLIAEVPNHYYDSADYSVIDQGLFIA
ncbi:hypothetical protein PIB30_075664 [Stylosanthes scabra]|uniref:Response regulatory domain-containing protein n=1 Tax=Stylosanthes scabra TaxID=79078 RepID=A0ABU6UR54_9FABA|nr:hypothetical protein [Stylosanthes scabra]